MSFAEGDIIITTANDIPGRRVVKVLGVALGITVRSRGLGGNLLASLRSLVGARSRSTRRCRSRPGCRQYRGWSSTQRSSAPTQS